MSQFVQLSEFLTLNLQFVTFSDFAPDGSSARIGLADGTEMELDAEGATALRLALDTVTVWPPARGRKTRRATAAVA